MRKLWKESLSKYRAPRYDGAVQESEGDERVFIPGRGSGWQMRKAPTPCWDAAGGEGGHRAAKPEGVIHKYISNQ